MSVDASSGRVSSHEFLWVDERVRVVAEQEYTGLVGWAVAAGLVAAGLVGDTVVEQGS